MADKTTELWGIHPILEALRARRRNFKKLLLSSAGITCFMYLIFIVIMKSNLPPGVIVELFLR